MLKKIPPIISPELFYALLHMGHGDEIVIADGNFPAASHAQELIRADGIDAIPLLEAIMEFFPIDRTEDDHAIVMAVDDPSTGDPPIWKDFISTLRRHDGEDISLTQIERHAFYNRAQNAFCIIATSESALYANLILKKGVVT